MLSTELQQGEDMADEIAPMCGRKDGFDTFLEEKLAEGIDDRVADQIRRDHFRRP